MKKEEATTSAKDERQLWEWAMYYFGIGFLTGVLFFIFTIAAEEMAEV